MQIYYNQLFELLLHLKIILVVLIYFSDDVPVLNCNNDFFLIINYINNIIKEHIISSINFKLEIGHRK